MISHLKYQLVTTILTRLCFYHSAHSRKMTSLIGKIEEIKPKASQSGVLIFLHGSGDTGHGVKAWVEMLLSEQAAFPHMKILFPTAPVRPYTPLGGQPSNVWFNRKSIRPDVPEELDTIEPMAKEICKLIEQQVIEGTPMNRIILGGFSMGGAMAFHVGYRYKTDLAGIFALSSFLNEESLVEKDLASLKNSGKEKRLPPLYMCHGERDDLVKLDWGEKTYKKLTSLGVTAEFHQFPNMLHELKKKELQSLYSWVNSIVRENSKS